MEYGCIGKTLKHSFSAEIHPLIFDYSYVLHEVAPEELDEFMKNRDFKAINVTIPYKSAVIPYLYHIDENAKKIGAVNTIVNKDGKLYGYNTDFSGMKALIQRNKIDVKGKRVLILGSGGTSKTAKAVFESLEAAEIKRVSRSGSGDCITYEEAIKDYSDTQIILNATPCGMFPDTASSPIELTGFSFLEAVVDVVYNPIHTSLVCKAGEMGIKSAGGLYMLVSQAVFAAEYFKDVKINDEVVEKIYKQMLSRKQNVVLVGMPGSGKTTVGKVLAERLQKKFVDTDELIEEKYGVSPSEMIRTKGEETFRNTESEVIAEISDSQALVIATGGGAILRDENVEALKRNGRIYFLDRPLERLVPTSDRPLSSNIEMLKKRYNERYGLYGKACDKKISGDMTAEEFADKIEVDFK